MITAKPLKKPKRPVKEKISPNTARTGSTAAAAERGSGTPKILLIAPLPIQKLTDFAKMFEGGTDKWRLLGQRYAGVAKREGVAFLDAGAVIRCSDLDGIHYEADQHERLGRATAEATLSALADPAL
jgi:hypothetical protein